MVMVKIYEMSLLHGTHKFQVKAKQRQCAISTKNNANEAILQHKYPTNFMNTKVDACVCSSVTY